MKKQNIIGLVVGLIIIVNLLGVASALRTQDIMYKFRVTYEPSGNCSKTCSNSTEGNITTESCYETCKGIIKIESTEDRNHLTVIERLEDLTGWNSYTGYKTAELGNESDLSNLVEAMDKWVEYENKYNRCLDSNRKLDANLTMLAGDIGFKEKYNSCTSNLNSKTSELTAKTKEVEDLEGGVWTNRLLGLIVGFLLVKIILPKMTGKDTPKDESEQQFGGNVPY